MDRETYAKNFVKRRDQELPDMYQWLPPMYRAAAGRMDKLERQAERQFPGIFDRLDAVRAGAAADIPTWCWLPVARVQEALANEYSSRTTHPPGVTGRGAAVYAAADAARLAALGAWRAAGRHMLNVHDSVFPLLEAAGDELPEGLPERWPLYGLYVVSETPGGKAMGAFLHLEWDEREKRAELRIVPDVEPVASLDRLPVQPLHLEGGTVTEAARRTLLVFQSGADRVQGVETVPDISPGSELDKMAHVLASKNRFWVAMADWLASERSSAVDAAWVVGRETAGAWPAPGVSRGRAPLLWLVAPADM